MERVVEALRGLRDDRLLQMDLKDPEVLAAIDHWTGRKRLKHGEAEKRFDENYQVRQVLDKLRRLQVVCREAKIGVPLKALLAGSDDPLFGMDIETEKGKEKKPATMTETKEETRQQEPPNPNPSARNVSATSKTNVRSKSSKSSRNLETPAADDDPMAIMDSFIQLTPRNVAIWWSFQIAFLATVLVVN